MKKLLKEDFGANVAIDPKRVAVLFDFDGTIGDTETPAMEVAYWELAPYFPGAASKQAEASKGIPFGLRARLLWSRAREIGERCVCGGNLPRREWLAVPWRLCIGALLSICPV